MTIAALLVRDEHADQRQTERWVVRLDARSSSHGSHEHALTMLNLSQDGFLLETDQILPVNAPLVVEMPGGVRKSCRTVWNSGRQHGAIFYEPLTDAEFQAILAPDAVIGCLPSKPGVEAQDQRAVSGRSHDIDFPGDVSKYPRSVRLLIGAGASAGLWGMIGSALWLAWS